MPIPDRWRQSVSRVAGRLADATTPQRRPLPLARLRGDAGSVARQAMVRAQAGAVPFGDGVLLARSLGRHKLLLDADDLAHAPHLVADGFWEWHTTAWLLRHVRPGMHVVDAGASYGYVALLAADLVGDAGRVTAFEPHPRLAALLRRSLALNGFAERTRVIEAALAATAGGQPLRLRAAADDPCGARLLAADLASGFAAGWPGPDTWPVVTATLADLAPPPDIAKLDVPGAEAAAWQGARPLLEHTRCRLLFAFDARRCTIPAALLADMAAVATLRRLDAEGAAQPVETAALLAGGEAMLLLERRA